MPYRIGLLPCYLLLAALAGAITTSPASGQADSQLRARSAVSLTIVQTRPVGALGDNIGLGYGLTGSFLLPLDPRGVLSLRADIGAAEYGSEVKRSPFSESAGGRVEVNVRTVNAIVPASLGLQLTLPTGPLFTYASAGLGGQAFYTESRVEPTSGHSAIASTINQSDVTPAWTFGGGVYVPLRIASSNLQLDIGAQYIGGGRAQYLAPGSITDLPGGQIGFTPMESSTHLVVVRFGIRMGL
jgi:hypothetical protein